MIKNSLRLCPGLCSVPVLVSALVSVLVSVVVSVLVSVLVFALSVVHLPNIKGARQIPFVMMLRYCDVLSARCGGIVLVDSTTSIDSVLWSLS